MKKIQQTLVAAAASLVALTGAQALAAMVTTGATVTTPDASATFDILGNQSVDGTSYSEGDLAVRADANTISAGFDAFGFGQTEVGIYYFGSAAAFVEIFSVAGDAFSALDVLVGDGNTGFGCCRGGQTATNIVYEIERNGQVIASGSISTVVGTIFAVTDAQGFDLVRLAAWPNLQTLGGFQAIALDNLNVDYLSSSNPVPVPAAALLFAPALAGFALRKKRK